LEDFNNYKTVKKAVKILMGKAEDIEKLSGEFEKTHHIINIIQKYETQMFIFYWIEVDPNNITGEDK